MAEPALRVTFCVLNLRMGGQVANLTSLQPLLVERGVRVQWALPEGVFAPDKLALSRFVELDALTRARATWGCLRRLPRGPGEVVHLVVPTPSFSPVCALASTQRARMLVQSEGLPTAFDREHVALLRESPLLMLPRMLLNHRRVVACARRYQVAQLVTTHSYARMLRELGHRDVTCIENVARFSASDHQPLAREVATLFAPGRTVVGYVGHAHAVKGVDDLLDAFALASPARPDLTLLLALSHDGSTQRLLRRAGTLPAAVRARIHFTGMVPVSSLLARLDVLVLPYRSIATTTVFPSLLLEADAAGCPVIVAKVAPLPDILPAPEATHVQVEARSPHALARALAAAQPRASVPLPPRLRLPSEAERVERLIAVYRRLAAA
jgi:glycosyltransferase involved in cell wall biosynthesis